MTDTLTTNETMDLIASDRVEGTAVYNPQGEKLGTVDNFMLEKRSGKAQYAVMEFGGFLGIGTDRYPIPWDMLTYDTEKGGYVVNISKDQLEEAPRYSAENTPEYNDAYGRTVYGYYGLSYPVL